MGRRLRMLWQKDWRTIVAVVDDVKAYTLTGPPDWVDGQIYLPLTQLAAPPRNLALVALVGNDPSAFEQSIPRLTR